MNRFGSNSFENENDQFAQNQRVGRLLAENNPRPWNEAPHPDQGFQNRHYSRPNYRPDYSPQNQPSSYQQPHFYAGAHHEYPANDPAWRHHDDRDWTERNDYKDTDYRYRSGHRDFWHEDYNDQYEKNQHPRHDRHDDSFFAHVGQGIREGWNNLFNRHPDEDYHEQRRHAENRTHREDRHWPNTEANYYNNNQQQRHNEPQNRPENNNWRNSGNNPRNDDYYNQDNWHL